MISPNPPRNAQASGDVWRQEDLAREIKLEPKAHMAWRFLEQQHVKQRFKSHFLSFDNLHDLPNCRIDENESFEMRAPRNIQD